MGFLAPRRHRPGRRRDGWVARTDAGRAVRRRARRTRSSTSSRATTRAYYIDAARRRRRCSSPRGFTDDLFPVDETLRLRQPHASALPAACRCRCCSATSATSAPRTSRRERHRLLRSIHAWFDHYAASGAAAAPQRGHRLRPDVPAQRALPRPVSRQDLREARARRVQLRSTQPQRSDLGRPRPGGRRRARPGGGRRRRLRRGPRPPEPETPTYSLAVHGARGFTLLGAPTVDRADLGQRRQAGRRPDRRPAVGRERRRRHEAPRRPRALPAAARRAPARSQLHPGAWRFEPGHTPELELLGGDPPYARPSNSSFAIDVSRLRLRLPVRQRPGAAQVRHAGPPPLLPGQRRAP